MEYTVIIAVGILMLVIVSYAIGVERGKRLNSKTFSGDKVSGEQLFAEEDLAPAGAMEEGMGTEIAQPEEAVTEPAEEVAVGPEDEDSSSREFYPSSEIKEVRPEDLPAGNNYIIQLASFRSEELARDSVDKLRWKDIKANYVKSGYWYQVYASGYRTIEEAKRAKDEFDQSYIDCYIRKVN